MTQADPSNATHCLRLVVIKLEELQSRIRLQGSVEVPDDPIDFGHHGVFRQTLRDALSHFKWGGTPRLPVPRRSIGQCNLANTNVIKEV